MCLFGKAHKVARCVKKLQDYLSQSSLNFYNFDMNVHLRNDWEFSESKSQGSLRLLFNMSPYNVMTSMFLTYKGNGDIVEELQKLTDEFCS